MEKIEIIVTGGTIDCDSVDSKNNYLFDKTFLPKMLEQSRNKVPTELKVVMLKDSLYMTDSDRKKILEECKACKGNKIIITHGTDTMPETAKYLGERISNKTIVLVGAMTPFNQKDSDALFNLGSAVASVQLLENGVYISMNGKIFLWNNVRKNKELGIFETLGS